MVLENRVPVTSKREDILKWNGWGYADSQFYMSDTRDVTFSGDRYDISGQTMPHFRPWFEENLGVDLDYKTPSLPQMNTEDSPIINQTLVEWMRQKDMSFSTGFTYRLNRSHGHTVHEIMHLRTSKVGRIPDVVVWPRNHEQVVEIVALCDANDIAIIPIGGGTSVTCALECPSNESRCIVSLDMSEMNRVLWVDEKNFLCRGEAGIVGIALEEQLNAKGFTMGHEPDSFEFSSLGGWVATRASGMKKNKYGNIEDLLVHVKMVTAKGVVQKSVQVPRISAGPDIHQFILGSEGTLGVITEVTFKIFRKPDCRKFGSIVFPEFSLGVLFMRDIAEQRCAPASVRLVDNEQFIMGQALKLATPGYFKAFKDRLKKLYITQWKGFDVKKMCAATLVFEGTEKEVREQEERIYEIGKRFMGLPAGEENGQYGYRLTFAIAYVRDFGFEYGLLGESFETSVPWDKVTDLCRNVKELLHRQCDKHGVKYPILASSRVTQVYDTGACVYFYFGFNYRGIENPLEVYEAVENAARDEILACGGSISHHHGIGKIRRQWLPLTVGEIGLGAMKAIKQQLDPNNIFAADNLFTVSKL